MFEGVLVDALVAVELGVLVRVEGRVVDAEMLSGRFPQGKWLDMI